jgi:alcohol dehydrogenase
LDKILLFLERYNCEKTLLVTGKKSFNTSGSQDLFSKAKEDYDLIRFSDFSENPKLTDVKEGIKIFKESNCDSIISIGGGSVIDMAKLISCLWNKNLNHDQFNIDELKNVKRQIPFMIIPTTAGSGSEATSFAVIYINGIKYSVEDETLKPDEVLLDPELSYRMPSYQKAVSGLDALSQSIESFWSKKATKTSREYSEKALKLIWNNLYNSVVLNDFEAHKKVLLGSNYAGKAINISKTTAPHALSYYFTSKHNIKHGHAVCLTLSRIYAYNKSKVMEHDQHYTKVFGQLDKILGIDEKGPIYIIDNFIKQLGVELDWNKLNIDMKSEFDEICSSINKLRLKNNPFEVDLKKILID